jgi:hypothetical protein
MIIKQFHYLKKNTSKEQAFSLLYKLHAFSYTGQQNKKKLTHTYARRGIWACDPNVRTAEVDVLVPVDASRM